MITMESELRDFIYRSSHPATSPVGQLSNSAPPEDERITIATLRDKLSTCLPSHVSVVLVEGHSVLLHMKLCCSYRKQSNRSAMASLASLSDIPSIDLLSWLFADEEIDGSTKVGVSPRISPTMLTYSDICGCIGCDTACYQRSGPVSHTSAHSWPTRSGTEDRRCCLFSRLQPCEYPHISMPDYTERWLGTILNHLSWGGWRRWMFHWVQSRLHQP